MSALCSLHPDVTAQLTCDRCGRFACQSCSTVDGFCKECEEKRSSTPQELLRRTPFSLSATAHGTMVLLRACGPRAFALQLPLVALLMGINRLAINRPPFTLKPSASVFLELLTQVVVITLAETTVFVFELRWCEGREVTPAAALKLALPRWPRVVANKIVVRLRIGLGVILLIIPGLLQAAALSTSSVIAASGREFAPREESERLTLPYRWPLVLVALIGWAFNYLPIVFTLALRLAPPFLYSDVIPLVAGRAGSVVVWSIGVALYYGLNASTGAPAPRSELE